MLGHVHMRIEVPPKYWVASVTGSIKGKNTIAIARDFNSEPLWARGFAVPTAGFELEPADQHWRGCLTFNCVWARLGCSTH